MFCIQEKTSVSTAVPCSLEKFNEMLDSERVKNICARITQTNDDEQRSRLKRQLPAFCWHASRFENDQRKAAGAIPSGLAMLDVDHVDDPRQWFESWYTPEYDQWLREHRVGYIGITPSAHGLRIVAERQPDEAIEAAMTRIAKDFNIETYDAVTKDLARLSFVSPRNYVLYLDEQVLFAESGGNTTAGSDPAVVRLEEDSTLGLSPMCSPTASEASNEPLSFRDIPYADIVSQLMLSIGAGANAVQGERNTVYFSLANYMRYICDFNEAMLLQVLPDFGLSIEERRQAIHSALGRPRKTTIPTILQAAIAL